MPHPGLCLYLFDHLRLVQESTLSRLFHLMPAERRERAEKCRFATDRCLSAISYGLLLYALREAHGLSGPVSFEYGQDGKPFLRENREINFNLSHCRLGAVCAIASDSVGVDIQDIQAPDYAAVHRFCNEREHRDILRAEDPSLEYTRLWTRKEALAKQSGQGLGGDLPNLLVDNARSERPVRLKTWAWPERGYLLSLAYSEGRPRLRFLQADEI